MTCCSLLQITLHSPFRVFMLLCVIVVSSAAILGWLFTDPFLGRVGWSSVSWWFGL